MDKNQKKDIWDSAPDTLEIEIRKPRHAPDADDSIEFHAARLLLLLYYAGGTRTKRIEGRTKLAKLDFFVRYPTYLVEAAKIKEVVSGIREIAEPESPMIRYKYGPWDNKYYDIFAFLVAKEFIDIIPSEGRKKFDIFQLTEKGILAVKELVGPEFDEIIERCQLVYKLFGNSAGSTIKNFIYENFIDVVNRPIGTEIDHDDE